MSVDPPDDDRAGPAEERLHELLGLLQADPPGAPPALTGRVLDAARWERGLRTTGGHLGTFGASLLEGLSLLLGLRRRR
jgi:hypothetical protein